MEAVGVDRGTGGTGWQARSAGKEIIETDTWQGFGCDNRLAEKSSPVAGGNATGDKLGRRRDLALPPSNGEEGRCNPNDQRDGYTRPHHADRALHGTVLIPEDRGNVRAQGIAGRTAAPPARRDVANPINVAEEATPRIRAPQANIQPTVPGGISAITSPHCSAQTTGGSGAGAAYKEPLT